MPPGGGSSASGRGPHPRRRVELGVAGSKVGTALGVQLGAVAGLEVVQAPAHLLELGDPRVQAWPHGVRRWYWLPSWSAPYLVGRLGRLVVVGDPPPPRGPALAGRLGQ